jgi:hypothetical protein
MQTSEQGCEAMPHDLSLDSFLLSQKVIRNVYGRRPLAIPEMRGRGPPQPSEAQIDTGLGSWFSLVAAAVKLRGAMLNALSACSREK